MSFHAQDQAPATVPDIDASSEEARPHVLLIISHLGHGGAQRVVCALANCLSREGYRVRIIVTKRRANNALSLDPAVVVEHFAYKPPARTFAHLAGLFSLLRWLPKLRARIKAIGAPTVVSFIRPTNVVVLLACLGLEGQRLVICERNDPRRQPLPRHWGLLSWLLYRTADLVACNSRGACPALAGYVKPERLEFLPNILTLPETQRREPLDGPTILAVGRIVPQKGIDVLVRALAEAGPALAAWRLVLLGEGSEERRLRELAEQLGVAERIEWRGHVADPFAFFRSATIFAMPSRYEGTPNALLEAMYCGLPCIVSDASPGPLEVVRNGVNGVVVATESVSGTADALIRLAGDPAERERLGLAARRSVAIYRPEQAVGSWKIALELPPEPSQPPAPCALPRSQHSSGRLYLAARQISHFAMRPKAWPALTRWLAKRIKAKMVGHDLALERARGAMREASAWCASRSCTPAEALSALGFDSTIGDLRLLFPEELAQAQARVDRVPFRLGGASNMDLIYTLCEALQVRSAVETGVAYGWSSLAILLSIAARPEAALHSVDLPYLKYQNDRWVGVAVPEGLKTCWTLHRMADRDGLPRALAAFGTIDFAHYDSDKSAEGRAFAYPLLWQALRPGGVLFSDDVHDNFGFRDFCDSIGVQPIVVRQDSKFQGILRKPEEPSA